MSLVAFCSQATQSSQRFFCASLLLQRSDFPGSVQRTKAQFRTPYRITVSCLLSCVSNSKCCTALLFYAVFQSSHSVSRGTAPNPVLCSDFFVFADKNCPLLCSNASLTCKGQFLS